MIGAHERSISKNRLATFVLAPLDNVLSSSESDERCILRTNTFSTLHEFERRNDRVNSILGALSDLFIKNPLPYTPDIVQFLNLGQASIETKLKRALWHCDRIADITASGSYPPIPQQYYWSILDGIFELPATFDGTSDELSRLNPLTRPFARRSQIEYIRSLPLEDACALFALINLFGYALMRDWSSQGLVRKLIVEENILRHGTWFLWSRVLGDACAFEVACHIASASRVEIEHWDSGEPHRMPPGLRMSLCGRVRELLGNDDEMMMWRVAKVVNGGDLDDEKKKTSTSERVDCDDCGDNKC